MLYRINKYFLFSLLILEVAIISMYAMVNFDQSEGISLFILSICYLFIIPICLIIQILIFLVNLFILNKDKKGWLIIIICLISIIILGITEWILVTEIANPLI